MDPLCSGIRFAEFSLLLLQFFEKQVKLQDLKRPLLPPVMGLQFLDLSLEDLHAIRDYLSTQTLPD